MVYLADGDAVDEHRARRYAAADGALAGILKLDHRAKGGHEDVLAGNPRLLRRELLLDELQLDLHQLVARALKLDEFAE